MDVFGDHALICSTGGDMITRHNNIRNLLYHICQAANLSPRLETKSLSFNDQRRPGDVTIPNWCRGNLLALDVTISSPLQSSLISQAAEEQGFAASRAEERKRRQFDEFYTTDHVSFLPFALEASGGLGSLARKFVKD